MHGANGDKSIACCLQDLFVFEELQFSLCEQLPDSLFQLVPDCFSIIVSIARQEDQCLTIGGEAGDSLFAFRAEIFFVVGQVVQRAISSNEAGGQVTSIGGEMHGMGRRQIGS